MYHDLIKVSAEKLLMNKTWQCVFNPAITHEWFISNSYIIVILSTACCLSKYSIPGYFSPPLYSILLLNPLWLPVLGPFRILIMVSGKRLADIGYRAFSGSMMLLTVYASYLTVLRGYRYMQRQKQLKLAAENQDTEILKDWRQMDCTFSTDVDISPPFLLFVRKIIKMFILLRSFTCPRKEEVLFVKTSPSKLTKNKLFASMACLSMLRVTMFEKWRWL